MATLARKVARAKWQTPSAGLPAGSLPADAVTADLRTTTNQLSFWEFDDIAKAFEETALVIAARGDRLDAIDITCVLKADLESAGITFVESSGNTCVAGLSNNHRDTVPLDAYRLVAVAKVVGRSATSLERTRRFSVSEIRKLLVDAIIAGRLRKDDLNEGVRGKI